MFPSGVLATIVALLVGIVTDGSATRLFSNLRKAGLVRSASCSISDIDIGSAQLCANIRWHIIFIIILTAAGTIYVVEFNNNNWEFSAPNFFGYILAALRFGRMAASGVLGNHLSTRGVKLNVRLYHRDGAGGLAFVGNFFLRQASALIVPMVWLVFWLVSMAVDRDYYIRYSHWWLLFLALFVIVVAIACLSLVRPMMSFGRMIRIWMADSAVQEREKSEMSDQDYDYEVALMPKVPISGNAVRTSLLGVVFPMTLAAASAIVASQGCVCP